MSRGRPRKEVINPMGQHGRNDNQQAHGHKSKVNGLWKPKKIGNKLNGPT